MRTASPQTEGSLLFLLRRRKWKAWPIPPPHSHLPPLPPLALLLINRANHKVPLSNMWACRANCCTFSGVNARSGGHERFHPPPIQRCRRSQLWPFDPFSLCYSLWGHRLTSPRWARALERIFWEPKNTRWLGGNGSCYSVAVDLLLLPGTTS